MHVLCVFINMCKKVFIARDFLLIFLFFKKKYLFARRSTAAKKYFQLHRSSLNIFFVFNGRVIFYKAVSHNVWRCRCCLLSNVCTHVGGEWIYCGMKESKKGRMMTMAVEKRVCSLFCSQSIVHSLTTWINISTRTQHPRCLWNIQIMLGALMSLHATLCAIFDHKKLKLIVSC